MRKIKPVWKWLLIALLAAGAMALALHFDAAVRHWVFEHSNRTARRAMAAVSRYGDWPEHVLAGLLLAIVAWLRGNPRWVRIALTMILACAIAGIASRGLKVATGRARPSVKHELGWNGPRWSAKYHSFPSGHTAATTAFFGVLIIAKRRVGLALLPIPFLIAASRIYVAAHYLSDVVGAAIIGFVCAWLCARACLDSPPAREK